MSEHTNLPWRASKGGYLMAPDEGREVQVGKIGDFFDKELLPFNKKRWQADIELIVKAVNNHDALVAALQQARARIEYLGAACSNPKHFESNAKDFLPAIDAVLGAVGNAAP